MSNDITTELAQEILRVLDVQHEDEIERLSEFNPLSSLNTLFPDQTSLSQIEAIHGRLREDQRALQEQIDVLQEELRRGQDPDRMQLIQEMIGDLFAQMNRIREKATESEAIVRDITKDIQVLDLAKKNLITSMDTLKRFQMLVNALGQLDEFVAARKYADIAQTLNAVKQIATHFKDYNAVDRIAIVTRRVQEVQGRLRTMLDADFDHFMLQDPARAIKPSVIRDACLVVDVIGEDVRNHFIEKYCSVELREYRRIFKATDEAGQLDNVSRRFAWFRRVLSTYDEEHASVYPEGWAMGQRLCAKFSELTRDDLVGVLQKATSGLTVGLLLESLQHVLDFELFMSKRFKMPVIDVLKVITYPMHAPKTISSAFEPHMNVFVDAQDKALADMLAPYRGPKARSSLDNTVGIAGADVVAVLPSSTELFYFYGQNLEQCAKLSNRAPLFDLCNLHRKWLRVYAEDVLLASLKHPSGAEKLRKSTDGRVNLQEVAGACALINTAEYCHVTTLELEDKIKEKISDEYKERVTLQAERDLFMSVISSAVVTLLRELDGATETFFKTLAGTSWISQDAVHGQSPYVSGLITSIESIAETVRNAIEQKKWTRNFLDKATNLVITRFTSCIVKSRPLRELGAEQILLDLQALRTCLLKIPGVQQNESSTATFTRAIMKSTSSLDSLLKVVMAPIDPRDAFIQNYLVIVGDSSFANFQKILDLKGTPRNEANALVDKFITTTSTRDDLQSTSFLSHLDMDPNIFSPIKSISPNASAVHLPNLGTEPSIEKPDGEKRVVFGDLRRFVTFAMRRDKDSAAQGS